MRLTAYLCNNEAIAPLRARSRLARVQPEEPEHSGREQPDNAEPGEARCTFIVVLGRVEPDRRDRRARFLK
jgi:hypothetical protein